MPLLSIRGYLFNHCKNTENPGGWGCFFVQNNEKKMPRIYWRRKNNLIWLKSYSATKRIGMVIAMSQDIFTLFEGMTTEHLMEIISESKDDFLCIFDIHNNKIEIFKSVWTGLRYPTGFWTMLWTMSCLQYMRRIVRYLWGICPMWPQEKKNFINDKDIGTVFWIQWNNSISDNPGGKNYKIWFLRPLYLILQKFVRRFHRSSIRKSVQIIISLHFVDINIVFIRFCVYNSNYNYLGEYYGLYISKRGRDKIWIVRKTCPEALRN